MSNTNWTPSQSEAIFTKYRTDGKSCNILVNAAAGSGKTAVLVERIIQKLIPCDISKSIDIDKLLVVTFTNAAAAEMSERISRALSAELEKASVSGDTERKRIIKRQQLMLGSADITTIDAFCLRVIRENFNLLDVDPCFSIADEGQAMILADEVMEDLFSQLYDESDEEFINLLCLYATSRSDDGLAALIKYIHKFSRSLPHPFKRLYEMADDLTCRQGIKNTVWFQRELKNCKNSISDAMKLIEKGFHIMSDEPFSKSFFELNPPEKGTSIFDEWKSYYKTFYSYYYAFSDFLTADTDSLIKAVSEFSCPRLSALKSKEEDVKDKLKAIIESIKGILKKIQSFLGMPLEETEIQSREKLYPVAMSLIRLTEKYDIAFSEKKKSKNLLEFSDIEQLALTLFSEFPDVSDALKNRYDEILMDEYQDTNALQDEIFAAISTGDNMFMVGDMKQSIYRFRSSDPTIFKQKNTLYQNVFDAENRKIILSKNFRSRSSVLDGVNDIFESIMSEDAGELDYDDEQRLYLGNTGYTGEEKDYICECCVIQDSPSDVEDENIEDISRAGLEARFIAAKINEMKAAGFEVRDGDTRRPLENRDIVILMSSYKKAADIYISEFAAAGIECFAETQGYFEKNEIRLMLSLLKIINNPYNDVPLLGILRSPLFNFSDDELVIIRKSKKGKFFEAVKQFILLYKEEKLSSDEEIRTAKKSAAFYDKLKKWRGYSRYMSSDKLLWTLFEESDFYAFAGAMNDGEEAQANLRLLFERAKQYESNGFQGIFNFVKYIENLKQKDTDLSSAGLIGEGHNIVRIMTIHKSKGLEFPVVFIAGGGKRFFNKSEDSRVLLHKDAGIGMDYIDFEYSYRYETPSKLAVKSIIASELMSEEIRKLYVAMTRAKEKLFFVASTEGEKLSSDKVSGLKKHLEKWQSLIENSKVDFSSTDVLSAKGFVDWVAPVAMASKNWTFTTVNYNEIAKPEENSKNDEQDSTPHIDISHILEYSYPYASITDIPTKVSVSDFKAIHKTDTKPFPSFLGSDTEAFGTSYGTALHLIMQNLEPCADMTTEYVASKISDLISSDIIKSEDADKINPQKIVDFYKSEIGKRILASENVYREQAFEVSVPVSRLYPEVSSDETILLQGVIDCCFEEDGEIVLIDYKTDRYTDVKEIHDKYDEQLALYSLAIEKILQKNVKNAYIYLFFDGNVI